MGGANSSIGANQFGLERFNVELIGRRKFMGGMAAALAAAGLPLRSWALSGTPKTAADNLLFGVDYYPDQTPEALWEEDARMMADFGFTNVRIAEFAWALMEPSEGKFDFAWLHRSLEILHKHDIAVILGTPTAAPPPWLSARYPEILEVNEKGEKLHPGGRRFTCPTNATYRRLSLAIATEMARAFSGAPGVIGWQVDNEFTLSPVPRCYCNFCQTGFQAWVRSKYGSLDSVNQNWGTVFWSQTYTDFAQIPVPLPSGGDPNPGLTLDYYRYQSDANVSYLEEQLGMLRKVCPHHFVTTNNVAAPVDYIDLRRMYKNLDFAALDNYPGFFEMLMHEQTKSREASWDYINTTVALQHDFARNIKRGKPFMIMEEQSGKAGQPKFSPQPEKGLVRLWTYQAIAHGAMGLNYFRWDTANFGTEEYWHGILTHARSKSPAYDEIKQTVKELKSLGPELLNSDCPADMAVVFDYDSDWALQIQPGHYALRYADLVTSWYGSISSSHTGIDVIAASEDLSRYKIVFAPLLYMVSETAAAKIRDFVQQGGTFVSNFRLGVKSENSQIVRTALPGLLRDVMGVTVDDYVPIYSGKQGVKFSGALSGPDGDVGLWMDLLHPVGAEVLGTYSSGEYAGHPAITMNSFGKGKAVYIGADLDGKSLYRVLQFFVAKAGVAQPLQAPAGVEVTVRKSGDRQWMFLLNHNSTSQMVNLPNAAKDLLTSQALSGRAELGPYEVRVLQI
jgi:beta-galactosidase